jgi:hypothetical protein
MSTNRVMTAVILSAAALAVTACGGTKQALGLTKVTPDEFRVVTKAPLVVPPDYALRPPAQGEPRPTELQPESAARQVLLSARQGENRSEGEKLLVARAGADRADPLARYVVDDEFGDIAYKDKSFADHILFWRKDKSATASAAPGAQQSAAIDPAAEAARLQALTGGKSIMIGKQSPKGKLPGL